jgi:hypothetical protein
MIAGGIRIGVNQATELAEFLDRMMSQEVFVAVLLV